MMASVIKTEKFKTGTKKSRVLDCFSKLSHKNSNLRIKNGIYLLKYLTEDNSQEKETEEKYTLDRIIRGLGSANEDARTGYYAVLVALLHTKRITFNKLKESVEKNLKPSGNNPKSENADIFMGQILAYGATLRSNNFYTFTQNEQKEILEKILDCRKKKSYLYLAANGFIVDLIEKAEEGHFKKHIWPILQSEIFHEWSNQNLNDLYILIIVKNKFPKVLDKNIVKKKLGPAGLFSGDTVKHLANILLDIPIMTFLQNPAYALISQEIAKTNVLINFINELDRKVIKPNRNKFLAMVIILTNVIIYLEDYSLLSSLVPTNFLLQLQHHFKNMGKNIDKEIIEKVNGFFDAIALTIRNPQVSDSTKIDCLKKLLLYPGHIFIEKNVKIKIVQQITATLGADAVKEFSEFYKDIVTTKLEKETFQKKSDVWLNTERVYASQMFARLLSHPNVRNEIEWKTEQLKFFLHYGFVKDEKTETIGVELAASLRETFYHSLDLKLLKLEHARSVLSSMVHYLQSFITQDNPGDILRVTLTSEGLESWQKAFKQIEKFEERSAKSNKPTTVVFHTLFLHMSLHLFNEQKLAITSLNELFQCYKRSKEEKKKRMSQLESSGGEGEVNWIEVVVDLFLNLLSQNSVLLRKLICCVFPHLCKDLTPSAVHQILAVLDPKNETDPLSNPSDSEDSDDEEEDEEADDAKEDEDSNDEDIDYEEEEETVNDKLRTAIRQALGGDAALTDEESVDLDEMDENKAEEIDKALSQAFKQFKPNKGGRNKKQSKEAEALTHFRTRALDLVEIYLDSEPPMLTCLEIMVPLLNAFEFTVKDDHQKPLQDRLSSTFKKLTSLKKFSSYEGVNGEVLSDLMASLLDKGTKSAMIAQEMSDKVSKASVFIVKCSTALSESGGVAEGVGEKLEKKLVHIINDALDSFFQNKNFMTSFVFFKNILEQNWNGIVPIAVKLFEYVFPETVKPFKRSQALELLTIFYKNYRFLNSNVSKIQTKLRDVEVNFSENLIRFLQSVVENPKQSSIREKYVTNVFNLLVSIKKSPLEDGHMDWGGISDAVRKYRIVGTFSRDAKAVYNRLSGILKLPQINAEEIKNHRKQSQKQDNEDEPEDEKDEQVVEEKLKKKKNNLKDEKKLKKETRLKRLQSNSEGLIDIAFSNTRITENGFNHDGNDKFVFENGLSPQNVNSKIGNKLSKTSKGNKRKSTNKIENTPKKIKKGNKTL